MRKYFNDKNIYTKTKTKMKMKKKIIAFATIAILISASAAQAQSLTGFRGTGISFGDLQVKIEEIKSQISQLTNSFQQMNQGGAQTASQQNVGSFMVSQPQMQTMPHQIVRDGGQIGQAQERLTPEKLRERTQEIMNLSGGNPEIRKNALSIANSAREGAFNGQVSISGIGTISASSKEELIQKMKSWINNGINGVQLTSDQKAQVQSIITMIENGVPTSEIISNIGSGKNWAEIMATLPLSDEKAAAIKASLEEMKTNAQTMINALNKKDYTEFNAIMSDMLEKELPGYTVFYSARKTTK